MGENSELEEGEMNCSTSEGVLDLDVDLSYIDKKVQNVLGHLQKDFGEGALDLCGPRICDYGSFLPTYKRSLAMTSFQRSSQGNLAVRKFSNNLSEQDVVQKFQSLPNKSYQLVSNQDPQNCQTLGSLLAQAPGKVAIEKGNARIPGKDLSDHKPIRVRIKMGSEILSRKVTMVCNDLGLDDSPNSPPQYSHDDSRKMLPHTSLEKTSESPSRILQEMMAILVPKDLLMSPLPHSLFLLKDKERQYSLLENEPVVQAEKEPSIKTQNKCLDILGSEEISSGRRRKAVNCFDATTWNETLSIGEMKKQKILSTGQLARENSTFGLGEASSTNDARTTKFNLQKSIKKDGKSDPKVSFAKSNKTKDVKKHAEKKKMTYPTMLKQNISKTSIGDKFLSKMSFKDAVYIGKNSMDVGVDFVVSPSSTSLDLDNWAQCDTCERWRLLPFGLKPDQLPDKWLCSMQTWLPGMNYCDISEEETTNAVKSFHGTEAHGREAGDKFLYGASNADKSYQSLIAGSLPYPIEKKFTVRDLSHGVSSNVLVEAAKPMRSNSRVFKIKNTKLPLETPNATRISTEHGVSHDFAPDKIDQKAKWQSTGTGRQIKIKKKKEGDKQESEDSKQIKSGYDNKIFRDNKAELYSKQDMEWTAAEIKTKRQDNNFCSSDVERGTKKRLRASKEKPDHKTQQTTGTGSLCKQDMEWTPAEKKRKRQDNNFCSSDVERGTKKRLLASKEKPGHKSQQTTGTGSLCTKAHGRINSPVGKIRLMGYKQGKNENNSELFAVGEGKVPSIEKAITTKVSVQEIKAQQRNEFFPADGSREHQNADASCIYFSAGSGQISRVETSSYSKIHGVHKSGRRYVEELKASDVSSSPARSSYLKNLAFAGESISCNSENLKNGDTTGSRIVNNRITLSQEADREILSTHPRNTKLQKPEVREQNTKSGDLPCTSMNAVLENRAGINNFNAITHDTIDRSCQGANDILQEAEKLRKLADCFKSSGFDYEHKEANFKAALKFLLGASLLEMCSTENAEVEKMSHVEAYHTAAKLSESCAHQYKTSQEMAAAALAYKCMEVACMRVVYGRSLGLSGEWTELQKLVQMTPQGESPSSSASDVDSYNHQGVIDKSAKTKRGLSHAAGNLLPVARSQQSLVLLLDFTENMNLAMQASAKSQNAFRAAFVTSEETQYGDCFTAIKKVVDYSFHDVEALIQMIELAMDVLSSSRSGPKC